MTLEDFKTWRRSNDWLEDYAYDFFACIRDEFPQLLSAPPERCYFDSIEAPSDVVLLIRYDVGNSDYKQTIRISDLDRFLKCPADAARRWARETIEIKRKNKEKEDRLKQEQFEEYQKDMEEYKRIKEKYGF